MKKQKLVEPNPIEKKLFFHRLLVKKFYGTDEKANYLAEKLGAEKVAQISDYEFWIMYLRNFHQHRRM